MTDFVVGIPWRGGDPQRERALNYVAGWLDDAGVTWMTHDADPNAQFSRSASKNELADMAFEMEADVIIFNDADMVIPQERYAELAQAAYDSNRLVAGYTEYRALSPQGTEFVLERGIDPFEADVAGTTWAWSTGGVIAVRLDGFELSGGYDERFRGWGCEDTAFAVACITTLGPFERLEGASAHLWHEHSSTTASEDDQKFNGHLLWRYNQVTCVDELREVQRT